MEDGNVLGHRHALGGGVEAREVDVERAAVAVVQLGARHAEVGPQLDQGKDAALDRRDLVDRAGAGALGAAEVRGRVGPPLGSGEVGELADGEPGRERLPAEPATESG